MTRIRSLKPEFWSSPGIETMDPYARLLYMAMWNWADDNGVGVANPRELLGFAFPLDEEITVADLRRMLVEIRRVFEVNFYTVAGRAYFAIPSWEKHQKFDRRSQGKHPGPDKADSAPDLRKHSDSTETHEPSPSPRRDSVAGTGEQGNRGIKDLSDSEESDDTNPKPITYPEAFLEFWEAYPRKDAKRAALKAWNAARKTAPAKAITEGARRYAANPKREDKFTALPATWLNAGRWEDEEPAANRSSNVHPNYAWANQK